MSTKTPSQILHDAAETHEQKDDDYGASWRAIGHILHGLTDGEPVVLETPEDFISFGLFTRRLDKIARCFNGEFLSDGDLNYESIGDSHTDETAYAAMHAALLAEQEPPDTITFLNDSTVSRPGESEKITPALRSVDCTITVGGSDDEDDEYEPTGDEPQPGGPALTTEEDYDDALPVDPRYQAKYEELVRED